MKIAQFRDTLKEFSKPATINKYITLISVAIRTAINEWGIYLPTNPADKIKRLKEPGLAIRELSLAKNPCCFSMQRDLKCIGWKQS